MILNTEPNSIGYPPQILQPQDYLVADSVLETLAHWTATGGETPWLATAWKANPKAKSVTVTLRKGVRFQDGTPFNANAVKFNIQLMMAAKNSDYAYVKSIQVKGPYSLTVHLSQWDATFLDAMLLRLYLVSPASYRNHDQQWAISHPVGTGPFTLVSWNRGVDIKFKRNPDYWQKGKPYLDGLDFRIISDPTTALAAFQSGEADVYLLAPDQVAASAPASAQVVKLRTSIGAVERGITFDSGNPKSPFADVRVREAVAYAINRDALLKGIFKFSRPTPEIGLPGAWSYNPKVPGFPYSPERAKQLLAQAGYPNGFSTTFTVLNDPASQEMATAVQSDLAQVGIKVQVQVVDPAKYFQLTSPGGTGWSGMMQWGFNASPNIISTMPHAYSPGGLFGSSAHPDEVLQLLAQARAAETFKAEQQLAWKLQSVVFQKYVLDVPIGVTTNPLLKTSKVHGDGFNQVAVTQWTPQDAWLSS